MNKVATTLKIDNIKVVEGHVSWIGNGYRFPYWRVAKSDKSIDVDFDTPRSHLTIIYFNKKISSDNLLTDKINCRILADVKQCLKNTFESGSTGKPYRLKSINRNIISFILSVNEEREVNGLPPILTLNQITKENVLDFLQTFQISAEQFYAVIDELNLLKKHPKNKDWEGIKLKLKIRSKTFSIIKARITHSKLPDLYISSNSKVKEYYDANISRNISELIQVNKKTVQNITSDIDHLFSNSQGTKYPINFSPNEASGGDVGLSNLFSVFQTEIKTAAMPLEVAFHLISQSMKFQHNYGPSLLKYLKAVDNHYKDSCKHLELSTLLKECTRRERLFLEVECPTELNDLNIKILGLEHEIKREDNNNESISLVNAIQLYLSSIYILLTAFLATRELSVLLLKRNCLERSPLDDLCDIKFKQQKSSKFNILETIHRPIPSQIYDLVLVYCEFSQYLEQRYGIFHDDEESYLLTNFHEVKKIITRHFTPSNIDMVPDHLYQNVMQTYLDYFSDWSAVPLSEGKRWYATEHQFRRLFAILYFNLSNEEGIEELSWFLGHGSLEMTFGYAEINPSSEWMDEAAISISKRATSINENLNADKTINKIIKVAKEKTLKLNLQLEDVVYQAINERINKTGEEVHFKRSNDKNIYFYFTEGTGDV
jgi:hypothetical protein